MTGKHSPAFLAVRDAILALDSDKDRARLAALFGDMTTPHRDLGELRRVLRLIAMLDDADLERLAKWFSTWVSRWGQMPRSGGMSIDPGAHRGDSPSSKGKR
jgi:hypothetical protein